VPPATVELRPTIDRIWLERVAADDPLAHAYALWDLDRYPDRVQFVSAVRGEETLGYLLIWLGPGTAPPVALWFGEGPDARSLAEGLPPRPLVAVVPDSARAEVERARGPLRSLRILVLRLAESPESPDDVPAGEVRRLGRGDSESLRRLTLDQSDLTVSDYPYLDLDREAVWGCFEEGHLRAVARAPVQHARVWLVSGVFVDPSARNRGFGLSVVRAVLGEARTSGANVGLYVREDQPAARRVYEKAGFRLHARRVWLDAGAGIEP
jgi:ribosomal protein S18 acetylase RimI-like enzyme